MKKLILKLFMVAILGVISSLDAFSACHASFSKTINGLTVSFQNTSTYDYSPNYYWIFGDGTFSTTKDPIKTYATAGFKSVRLYVSDSSGGNLMCASTVLDTIVLVSGTPTCNASFAFLANNLNVSFTNTSTSSSGGSQVHYRWDFGDGTGSMSTHPTKAYATGGVKIVTLVLYDSATACSSTFSDTLVLNSGSSNCMANFTKSISGLTVNLTNTSLNGNGTTAGLAYYWYFSEGPQSFLKNPSRTFTSYGVKFIQLQIFDSITNCTSTKIDSFNLSSGPQTCSASFTYNISGLNVSFYNTSISTSSTPKINYVWNFSDGTSSTATHPNKTFSSGGLKIAKLTLHDSSISCSSVNIDTFYLSATGNSCTAKFVKTKTGPFSYSFTNMSTNTNGLPAGLNYLWYFSDSTTASTLNVNKTFTSTGVKWALLFIKDSSTGCYSNTSDTFLVNGTSMCDASFFGSVNGLTVSYHNTSTNTNGSTVGLSYLWNFSDATTSTQVNPVKTYATAGQKIAKLTIFDSLQACYSFDMDTVTLFAPLCSASFTLAIDTTTPFHFYLLNTSLVRTNSTFLWNFGDGSSSTSMTPSHTYANFGTYLVCLTVSDSLCTSMFCDSVGMDSTGILLKGGAFGFQTLDFTTKAGSNGLAQEFGSNQYAIYPNPSNAIFNVEVDLKSASPITYQVTDISGKIVLTKSMMAPSGKHAETIDLSDVQSSIYFLSISSNDGISTHKIIKN
ncbi:MAG: PKD domain-containing protein [Bacteroidia bacterium]|nr:PKD domain-containing protein [Bacteroidia bacterium]